MPTSKTTRNKPRPSAAPRSSTAAATARVVSMRPRLSDDGRDVVIDLHLDIDGQPAVLAVTPALVRTIGLTALDIEQARAH
ncbi:MAG: hypothetical protein ABL908_18360 [Hyphomicrobium sp.]